MPPRKGPPAASRPAKEDCRPTTDTHIVNEMCSVYEYVLPLGDNVGAVKDFIIVRGQLKITFQKRTPGFAVKGINVLEGTEVKWD